MMIPYILKREKKHAKFHSIHFDCLVGPTIVSARFFFVRSLHSVLFVTLNPSSIFILKTWVHNTRNHNNPFQVWFFISFVLNVLPFFFHIQWKFSELCLFMLNISSMAKKLHKGLVCSVYAVRVVYFISLFYFRLWTNEQFNKTVRIWTMRSL